jgi:hypothetical protein
MTRSNDGTAAGFASAHFCSTPIRRPPIKMSRNAGSNLKRLISVYSPDVLPMLGKSQKAIGLPGHENGKLVHELGMGDHH